MSGDVVGVEPASEGAYGEHVTSGPVDGVKSLASVFGDEAWADNSDTSVV